MSQTNLTGQLLGGHEIGGLLGRGGCGSVYRARTTAPGPAGPAGTVVALKVFHSDLVTDERSFKRFEREAELGMSIRHPHIVPAYACGSDGIDGTTYHFMSMEFVDGEVLRKTMADLGVVPEELLYQIADQILDALSAIHERGMIHRDLKPDNVVLTSDQQVRVMDLGIARLQQEGRDLTRAGEFIGSLAYAAPEQFLDQDHVDPRADVYALGVVLYEAATGVNPFNARELPELLGQKLRGKVRRPKALNRELDPFLEQVILTCMQKEPAERFASCAELRAVLAEGESGAWWTEMAQGEAFPAAQRALRSLRPDRSAALVAREKQLTALHEAFEKASAGGGGVVLLSGSEGSGKSRLAHDFLEQLVAPDGPSILAGTCAASEARPREALRAATLRFFGDEGAAVTRIGELLADLEDVAAGLVDEVRGGELGDDVAVDAYACLLLRLCDQRPLVLVLENLHRADPSTVAVFEGLAEYASGRPFLLVGTYSSDAVDEGSAVHGAATRLVQAAGARSIELAPLTRDECDLVLTGLVGVPRTVRALGRPLHLASDGCPLFLVELVEHLKAEGVLRPVGEGWVTAGPVRELALPQGLRELVALRLGAVDEDLTETLEAAAVQGVEFDSSLLADVTGDKRIRLLKKLGALERKHRVVVSAGRKGFRFATTALHQVVYDRIEPGRCASLHRAYAEAIDKGGGESEGAAALAAVRHMLAAGCVGEVMDRIESAIQEAGRSDHALDAAAFVERLVSQLPHDQRELRVRAWMHLAALQHRLGRAEAQAQSLERASAEAAELDAPALRAHVLAARSEADIARGRMDDALVAAEGGLELARAAADRVAEAESLQALGAVAGRRGDFGESVRCWESALELWRAAGDRRGEAETLLRLGAVLPEVGRQAEALPTLEKALEIARALGDRRTEGVALRLHANALVESEWASEALTELQQCRSIAQEIGDMPSMAAALRDMARVFAMEARIDDAKDNFQGALDRFRELDDPGGEASVLDEMGSALASFGDREEATRCLEAARDVAERLGETMLLSRTLRHLASVRHDVGDRESAWDLYGLALGMAPVHTRCTILADMGRAAEQEGDFERATELLVESLADGDTSATRMLALCRLARAHHGAGRRDEALRCAEQVEELIRGQASVPGAQGPEIYYSLAVVHGEETARGRAYLARSNEVVEERTRSIRSMVGRQRFMTTCWPNREVMTTARGLSPQPE